MNIENFRNEVLNKERFEFGNNWKNFQKNLNDYRIKEAENSLKEMLKVKNLECKTFLDIGSGSGLFSLAARNLGANVTSFDYDENAVWCTSELKSRFYHQDKKWKIMQGSVLDKNFLSTLSKFDYVYCWGVLHHTGDMWAALENIRYLVNTKGNLFISIYNKQQIASKYWAFVKKTYNRYKFLRPILILIHFLYPALPSLILKFINKRKIPRGMTMWHDLIDWVGGYPFEVSTPSEIFKFYKSKGFILSELKTVGGKHGCNEFVFYLDNKKI